MGIYSIVFDKDTSDFSAHGGAAARDALYACIENGDLAQFEQAFGVFKDLLLNLIESDLSRYKLTIQYVFAQLELVAVRAGLSLIDCCTLQDNYYRALENAETPNEAVSLLHAHCMQLTKLIAANQGLSSLTRKCCKYIQNHVYEELSLTAIAHALRYSESFLSHKFKEETGITVNKYVQDTRIAQSKQLLRQGYEIVQIAAMLRFSSQSHFSSVFRKNTGITPSCYRKQFLHNNKADI